MLLWASEPSRLATAALSSDYEDYEATTLVEDDDAGILRSEGLPQEWAEPFYPSQIVARIVGGSAASKDGKAFPYVTLLGHRGKIKCAGTLIADRVVLSAGHCSGAQTVYVQDLGETSSQGSAFRGYKVRQERRHPRFDSSELDYDATLLLLFSTPEIQPVALDTGRVADDLDSGDSLTVLGWGDQSESGDSKPSVLQSAILPYVRQSRCESRYGEHVTDRMMCFGGGEKDACQGDSGGPLVQPSRWPGDPDIQVGIISWGVGCAKQGYPGVYTRVHMVWEWIKEQVEDWDNGDEAPLSVPASSPRPPPPRPTAPPLSPPPPASLSPPQPSEQGQTGGATKADDRSQAEGSPDSGPAVVFASHEPVCPSQEWHIVRWTLHVPYDPIIAEAGLEGLIISSFQRRLPGLQTVPGLMRLVTAVVDASELPPFVPGSTCFGQVLHAEFWIHFNDRGVAYSFRNWAQRSEDELRMQIHSAIPQLCGASTSNPRSLWMESYCIVTTEDGRSAYVSPEQAAGLNPEAQAASAS
eukprot:CAMPEP_0117647824 /NCGR_PEP_ID=MMETSP0804-20121206/54_1 /TAXON_ID=1074897 /ORGANISM="Tetraselmis astigmatica, Strain CCMP880" /LENGTH=525 /DNA_ID=CAMNT_0005453339 /DNA_START=523 /DNA_END=2102 /DNA_ORIENTATION=+